MRRRPVARGATLFEMGEPFHSIFAVKSGAFKSVIRDGTGASTVVGFYLPGELIGTEAYAGGRYSATVRALENSSVCELRMDRLSQSGRPLEEIQHAIITLLSQDLSSVRALQAELIRQSGPQRVAAFLVGFAHRLDERGLGAGEFRLPMSRSDIASYLGLASETVSRIFTRFQRQGLIRVRGKRTCLIDLPGLRKIAG